MWPFRSPCLIRASILLWKMGNCIFTSIVATDLNDIPRPLAAWMRGIGSLALIIRTLDRDVRKQVNSIVLRSGVRKMNDNTPDRLGGRFASVRISIDQNIS